MISNNKNGWVYIIESGPFMKCGITLGRLQTRLKNYSTHNPDGVVLKYSALVFNPSIVEDQINKVIKDKSAGVDWTEKTQEKIEIAIKMIVNYQKESPPQEMEKTKTPIRDTIGVQTIPFTQIANCVLNNPKISARAKGIYAYLYSKPDGWDFNYIRIAKDHMEGKNTILKAIKELENAGYLERRKLKTGRTQYFLTFEPVTEDWAEGKKPVPKVWRDQSLERPKFGTISNIDNINNKDKESNKDIDGAAAPPKVDKVDSKNVEEARHIRDIIEAFGEINPACAKMYGRKDMREASRELTKAHTFEKVMHVIKFLLPKTNRQPYFPSIDTPVQLFNKWTALENACVKYKEKMDFNKPKGANIII